MQVSGKAPPSRSAKTGLRIAQSLGMLWAQEEFIRSNAAEWREKIAAGMEQIRRGEVVDGGTAIQNLREKLLLHRS